MDTMASEQLFDLFNLRDAKSKADTTLREKSNDSRASVEQVLEKLPESWEDEQYEVEYDLTQYS